MPDAEYLTAGQISDAFVEFAMSHGEPDIPYATLWSRLIEQGRSIRGATSKRQRDAVWRALASDPRIEKCGRGRFRLKAASL
jgi:hypothetical protein